MPILCACETTRELYCIQLVCDYFIISVTYAWLCNYLTLLDVVISTNGGGCSDSGAVIGGVLGGIILLLIITVVVLCVVTIVVLLRKCNGREKVEDRSKGDTMNGHSMQMQTIA